MQDLRVNRTHLKTERSCQELRRGGVVLLRLANGELLKAKFDLQADANNSIHIHWYQRQGDGHWKLVSDLSEETYRISQADRGGSVMAVMVVATSNGDVKRVSSNVIGPIQ